MCSELPVFKNSLPGGQHLELVLLLLLVVVVVVVAAAAARWLNLCLWVVILCPAFVS